MLNLVVTGTQGTLTPRDSRTFSDFISQEDDLENVQEISSVPASPRTPLDSLPEYSHHGKSRSSPAHGSNNESDLLKLAAKTVSKQLG